MENSMTLGTYIRSKRDELDLSLTEFAKLIGKTAPFLYDIELDRRHPSDEVLDLIAQHLKVKRKDLDEHDTRPPTKSMRTLTQSDPQYAFAFRRLANMATSGMTPDEIVKILDKAEKEKKS